MSSPAFAALRRIRAAAAAGRALAPEDGMLLATAIDRALRGEPLEEALGLAGGWRQALRMQLRLAAAELTSADTDRGRARELAHRLQRYCRSAYPADRASGAAAAPENAVLFEMLNAHGGKPPSEERIRKLL